MSSNLFKRLYCLAMVSTIGALVLAPCPAAARNTNFRFCAPSITWFANASPTPDGDSTTDPGWRGALRYVFDNNTNGTPLPNVVFQTVRDATNLYLSFEVHKSEDFADSDMIVLTFDPTGTAADRRRLHIYPVTTGQGAAVNVPPRQIDYWLDSSTWSGAVTPLPSWLTPLATQANLRLTTAISGTDRAYFLELKIPVTGTDSFPLPASGDFGLYLNVIRVIGGKAVENAWPPDTMIIGAVNTNTPAESTWGNGTIGAATCKGVGITSVDITANGGGTILNIPGPNSFSAKVHNETVNSAGNPVMAPQIVATFSIADFGITNVWRQIPVGHNPALPQDIAASSTATFQPDDWTITGADVTNYQAHPHQCVMVSLDARPPSTAGACAVTTGTVPPLECRDALIVNNAAVQNMDFITVSPKKFSRGAMAEIQTKGWAHVAGRAEQVFDLHVRTQAVLQRPVAVETFVAPSSGQIWTVHGYRDTGEVVTIGDKQFPVAASAGAFGYGLRYDSAEVQPKWRYQLFGERGNRLENTALDAYRIRIPNDQVGYLNVAFEGDDEAGVGGPVEAGPPTTTPAPPTTVPSTTLPSPPTTLPHPPPAPDGHSWFWVIVLLLIIIVLIVILLLRR